MKELIANGKKISLKKPVIMGILNLSPDSFYDGGVHKSYKKIIKKIDQYLEDGISILDIGAASSKPGVKEISEKEEFRRLLPALKLIRNSYPGLFISVDTYRSRVAMASAELGADMINDIGAGLFDENMFQVISETGLVYAMMHSKDKPQRMQINPIYKNVSLEVFSFLKNRISLAKKQGIKQIVVDPGFGFGKTLKHNYTLLRNLDTFLKLDCPVLVGLSRKSMIYKLLGGDANTSLNGTSVLNGIALLKGAAILRVHDAKEALEAAKLIECLKK